MAQAGFRLSASWDSVRDKIKEVIPELTDADLDYTPGKEDDLLSRLAAKLHRTKAEIKGFIESISFNRGMAN